MVLHTANSMRSFYNLTDDEALPRYADHRRAPVQESTSPFRSAVLRGIDRETAEGGWARSRPFREDTPSELVELQRQWVTLAQGMMHTPMVDG